MQLEAIATGGLSLARPGMPPAFSREANPSPLLLFRPPRPRGALAHSLVPSPNHTSPPMGESLALNRRPPTTPAARAAMRRQPAGMQPIGKTDLPAAALVDRPALPRKQTLSAAITQR